MRLFGRRPVEARVTSLFWRRVIQLERLEWVPDQTTMRPPDDARNVRVHTQEYQDMDTNATRHSKYYTFEQALWFPGRKLVAEGTDPSTVAWREYTQGSDERVVDLTEAYLVTLTVGDKEYRASLPEAEWRALEPGGSYQVMISLLGTVKKITQKTG